MIIPSMDQERRMYRGNAPDVLRRRMVERGESETDQTSDEYEIISALARVSETDRWAALRMLPDDQISRMADLIPLWQALEEMSPADIEQLLDEMDE
jgi:hypothetical protein